MRSQGKRRPAGSPRPRGALVALCALAAALIAAPAAGAQPAPEAPAPELVDRALELGKIGRERANLYRVYVLRNDPRLPSAYRSDTPFDGTVTLRRARLELRRMRPGPEKRAVELALAPPDPNPTNCDVLSVTPLPNSVTTAHFYVQYNEAALAASLEPLTIDDYTTSLEQAWLTQVDGFAWAAPPEAPNATEIDGKYHVRIDALAPVLYGFVSSIGTYAGPVGDNPSTSWDDVDADASCMGLNQDYEPFPGSAKQALDATTAHEFNHSIQFGYGALNGDNVPDDNFVEGGATWMEDEVQDAADDNYNYLYPAFDDSMGEHDEGDIYAYWLTWRGLTERFGTATAGGGEQVMQDFWELTSRNEADNLTAMQAALENKGVTLPDAYHDYAIAAAFLRACGGGYSLPHCFEEAQGYVDAAGETEEHGEVAAAGDSHEGTLEDNYALNWVGLPEDGGPLNVRLENGSSGGLLRGTLACDTGSGLLLSALPSPAGPGEASTLAGFDPSGCERAVAVLTNQAQTAPNPGSSAARGYTLSTSTGEPRERLTVSRTGSGSGAVRSDPAGIDCGSDCEEEYAPGTFVGLSPAPAPGSFFAGWEGGCSGTGACNVRMDNSKAVAARFEPVALPPPPIARDSSRPVLGSLRLSPRRFRAARSGPSIAARTGTRVSYRLSEAASTTITVHRAVTGRRVGSRCRRTTSRNRGLGRCLRYSRRGRALREPGRQGANSLRFRGRLSGRPLRPGLYRLTASARDAAGNRGRSRTTRFRVVLR